MHRNGAGKRRPAPLALMALPLCAAVLAPVPATAQFAIAGKKVPPAESNFAGVRQVSPRYGLVVQINHDARTAGDFELSLVDEIYAVLLRDFPRGPVVQADALPLVVTTQTKLDRFSEGGRRRMFRFLEPELKNHPDLHLSPTAIFIADGALGDGPRLRSLLTRALRFHFDDRFREAIESMDRPIPDRP
ncbi:MAG: hypothetical protein C5B48_03780 [Candidatus Rokuibacteriota bacterium]|nr:MAG: hypothetical protein C5B48_03780 [Candidatus Rokubacteria bacterium]